MVTMTVPSGFSISTTGSQITITNSLGVSATVNLVTPAVVPPVIVPKPVNLSSLFNVWGIAVDGGVFTNVHSLDGDGFSLSGTLLGTTQTIGGTPFTIGTAGLVSSISSATIPLPAGTYGTIRMLATGLNGNQVNQNFTVVCSDKSSWVFTQSMSDWYSPQNYSGESVAVKLAYRDMASGARDVRAWQVYEYQFTIPAGKTASSITLPNNRNVVVLAVTMQ